MQEIIIWLTVPLSKYLEKRLNRALKASLPIKKHKYVDFGVNMSNAPYTLHTAIAVYYDIVHQVHCKKVRGIPVPRRDVTNHIPPGRE